MKEGEIELLDSIWKWVKSNWSLSKLWDEVRLQEALVQVAKATGEEFEDHSSYSNQGMEDLLELNELASTAWTEIILPRSNTTIKGRTPLVLMGTCMNAMTEPLQWNDPALPRGLHVQPSYSIYNCGKKKTDIQLYNTKDHPIVLKKGTTVARMVAANEVPEIVVAEGTVGALWTHQWTREGHVKLSVKDWRKLLLEKLKLSELDSWMEENKEKALNLLVEYHDIFTLEDGEMECTKLQSIRLQ